MIKILTTIATIILITSYSFASSRLDKPFDSVSTFVCASSIFYDGKHETVMEIYQVSDFKLIETFSIIDTTFNVYNTELNEFDGKRTKAIVSKHKDSFTRLLVVEMEDFGGARVFSSSQWEECIAIN